MPYPDKDLHKGKREYGYDIIGLVIALIVIFNVVIIGTIVISLIDPRFKTTNFYKTIFSMDAGDDSAGCRYDRDCN